MASLTIHAGEGTYGHEICAHLAQLLSLEYWDFDTTLTKILGDKVPYNIISLLRQSPKAFLTDSPFDCTYQEYFEGCLLDKAKRENFLLYNFGGAQFLQASTHTAHLKLVAPMKLRIERVMAKHQMSAEKAEERILRGDRKNQRYLNTIFGPENEADGTYDLTISTGRMNVKATVRQIQDLINDLKTYVHLLDSNSDTPAAMTINQFPEMKNESEIEFAHMLDLYNIDWRYEPKTFPIEWDSEGRVTVAFSPDFYLPRFNLYLELTTMNQKYVTMKNKKARKVKELYPGVNVRIVYKKDFASMMERFEDKESGALPILGN